MSITANNPGSILISRTKIVLTLSLIAALLVLFSTIGQLVLRPDHPEPIKGLIAFFNSAGEGNLPTYFSSFLLLFAAFLLLIITLKIKTDKASYVSMWTILILGFIYLSLDEMLVLHERVSQFIRTLTDWSGNGILRSPWVILGLLSVIVLSVVFLKFFMHLDKKTRLIFFIAGFMYVGAALGFEIIENIYDESYGQDIVYKMMQNAEEGFEMAAIIVFISGLLGFLSGNFKSLKFEFTPDSSKKSS